MPHGEGFPHLLQQALRPRRARSSRKPVFVQFGGSPEADGPEVGEQRGQDVHIWGPRPQGPPS
eukprot:15075312-Alexandrium_andersonii.AAC.1